MVSHQNILFALSVVSLVLGGCLAIAVWASAGQDYVTPDYEGAGTARLFRVDYGVGFQGTITFFAVVWHFYFAFTQLKRGGSERVSAIWTGIAMLLCLMTLQTAVLFGNELMDAVEIDEHSSVTQSCALNDPDPTCFQPNGCDCSNGDCYKVREYQTNKAVAHSLEASVVFSVFLFLDHLVIITLLNVWKEELGAGGFSGGGGSLVTAGDSYQKL
eukprot:m.12369 g.12369  ORF g.12369 m.12369 type:complete len:215 (+) comp9256_c0_seq1:154-798(+)